MAVRFEPRLAPNIHHPQCPPHAQDRSCARAFAAILKMGTGHPDWSIQYIDRVGVWRMPMPMPTTGRAVAEARYGRFTRQITFSKIFWSEPPPSSCHCRGSGGLGGELLCPKDSGGFRYRHIANEVKPPQKQEFEGVVILLRKFAKKKVPSLNVILVLLPPYTMWRYPNPPEISQDFWTK